MIDGNQNFFPFKWGGVIFVRILIVEDDVWLASIMTELLLHFA